MAEREPMYEIAKEDGHGKAKSNTTCNGEDSVISALCQKKLICVNLTQKACHDAFADWFHFDGINSEDDRSLSLGKQNLFCSPRLNESESMKDVWKSNRAHVQQDKTCTFII